MRCTKYIHNIQGQMQEAMRMAEFQGHWALDKICVGAIGLWRLGVSWKGTEKDRALERTWLPVSTARHT